jgi:membrane protease YdiL (CAAX protease family)
MPQLPSSFMSAGEDQDLSAEAKRDFHFVLATAFVPVVLLPLGWWLAFRARRGPTHAPPKPAEHLREQSWLRRLRLVVAWDTIVAIAVALVVTLGGGLDLPESPPKGAPKMGIQLDSAWGGHGARIESVWPDSPAADAGLHEGDVIVAVDGLTVDDWEMLSDAIGRGTSGEPRMLRVERSNEAPTELRVVPEAGLRSSAPLFGPEGVTTCREGWNMHAASGLWPVAIGVFFVMVLWLHARLTSPGVAQRWGLVVVPLSAAPLVGVVVAQGVCLAAGGWSLGAVLVGTIAQGLTLLGVGALLVRWLGHELDTMVGPRLSAGYASRLAIFYISAVLARGMILLTVVWSVLPGTRPVPDAGANALFDAATSTEGVALVLVAVGLVAPLAEEVVFRGVLLPGLARRMRPGIALLLTSVVFALFHVPSHGVGAVVPGLLGVVFGWARLRTGGLSAPVILHAANNLFVSFLALSG